MRRYQGPDKPPGTAISPPPYSRSSVGRSNRSSTRPPSLASSGVGTAALVKADSLMVRGAAATAASYIDPRTKRPMMPPAGRSVPKLNMTDLTTSLAPLVESQMIPEKSPMSMADKRINAALREISSTKDLLESFDDAVKVPDMRVVNSKVAHLRRGTSISSSAPSHKYTSSSGTSSPKTSSMPSSKKQLSAKSAAKTEEQNVRRLMGELRDKYLEDMESQLGLAVDRRSIKGLTEVDRDQSRGETNASGLLPRPSTNSNEITARIDKVVREWAYEAQKLNKNVKSPTQKEKESDNDKKAIRPSATSPRTPDGKGTKKALVPSAEKKTKPDDRAGKNKNLAKISTAFKRNLDKYIAKKDVNELINIPEDNHVEKLEEEHEERRRAHESVFKNAITLDPKIPEPEEIKKEVNNNDSPKDKKNDSRAKAPTKGRGQDIKGMRTSTENVARQGAIVEQKRNPKQTFVESLSKAKVDENEVYSMIKDHMEYEMASGAPKFTQRRSTTTIRKPSKSAMLRSDPVGRTLLKYDSHKKLQTLVDSFADKIDTSSERPGPPSKQDETFSDQDEVPDAKAILPISSAVSSQATLSSRRNTSIEVTGTLSRSMKSIDRASNVAQRLGTLMSRVALRNEAYELEKKQKEDMERQARLIEDQQRLKDESNVVGTDINNNPFPPPSTAPNTNYSIKRLSTPTALQTNVYENVSNPYEYSRNAPGAPIHAKRNSVAPGVSKLDSSQFGKYVEQMKLVAEKAAESFEKFKDMQTQNDSDLQSFSEDEESREDEYKYQSNQAAYAVAAEAAEIAKKQDEETRRKTREMEQRMLKRMGNAKSFSKSSMKQTKTTMDSSTSPREIEAVKRNYIGNNRNTEQEFQFVPDMSYTDQLMLQKLRKMKEKEGWNDSLSVKVAQLMEETDQIVGDVPDQSKIESMIKKATNTNLTKQTEKGGMGAALSLNAILRARMNNN